MSICASCRPHPHDELLADFMAHPRTVIVSAHLIEEISGLFEQVGAR